MPRRASRSATDRDHTATDRDDTQADADHRGLDAVEHARDDDRGLAADDRRQAAADRTQTASDRAESQIEADQRHLDRGYAAADRAFAAADRDHTAADRIAVTLERDRAHDELRRAQVDHLTGALGRELGTIALGREINRARHSDGRLVLVFVDVDGLKDVNDTNGHAAGDELLAIVVTAIQAHLRSYDPVVRFGGDEFVCALIDTTPAEARRRFAEIQATVTARRPGTSLSFGVAALRPEDTLAQLLERSDASLYRAKRKPGGRIRSGPTVRS